MKCIDCADRFCIAFAKIVALKNIQGLDQHDTAGGRRRRADDFVSAIGAANGLALLHFVVRQILGGNQAATFLHCRGKFARQCAVVEIVGFLGDALERAGEVGLAENLSRLVVVAIALEDAARLGKFREVLDRGDRRLRPRSARIHRGQV